MNKKGGILDLVLAIVLSIVTVVCLVLFMFMGHTINTQLHNVSGVIQASFSDNATNVTAIMDQSVGKLETSFNAFTWIAPLFIFAFFISIVLSAFIVKQHPAWLFGYALIVVISVILSVYISNTYQTLMATPELATTFYSFILANYIFIYLPYWVTLFGFIAGVVMYSQIEL